TGDVKLNRRIREPYVRWCERSANQLMISLLLDCIAKNKEGGMKNMFEKNDKRYLTKGVNEQTPKEI
ncbi:hypothetical protein, partial [Enterococcus rivorum]|uniref:hypothetical protein n=2 Tax=Enterococcus rivorum TaxID=762845 RepID=UPI001B80A1C2